MCKKLKTNKARDELGMIYEPFKPTSVGDDLFLSLTTLFNQVKDTLQIPEFLRLMSITSFHKNKGPKSDLGNDRGVFNLSKIRCILDKLVYQDTYEQIDTFLSCSNVGGRK